jgi:putative ABC transport system permease protein
LSPGENLLVAVRASRANPLRSALTMLGIIIGVSAVIVMLALGEGAQAKVADQIRALGSNLLIVRPGAVRDGAVQGEFGSGDTLTDEDARLIARTVPGVVAAAPTVAGTGQIVRGNVNLNTLIAGVTPEYLIARDWRISAGRTLSQHDELQAEKVALLGATVARTLFGAKDHPVGQTIRIGHAPFRVVGVLAEKGAGMGRDQDDVVLIPLSTAKLRVLGARSEIRRDAVDFILVKVMSESTVAPAREGIRLLLRQRHLGAGGTADDFEINEPFEAMEAHAAATRSLTLLLAAIGSVSMVVGGISIMNIMLVSVTERTREIGLRQALGARRSDLRNQFLIEAVTLCTIGGVVGSLLGVGIAIVVAHWAGWPVSITPASILFSLAFAGAIGVFFGYYPAQKAARLNPIDALRHE